MAWVPAAVTRRPSRSAAQRPSTSPTRPTGPAARGMVAAGAEAGRDVAEDGGSDGRQLRVPGGAEALVAVWLLEAAGEQGHGGQGHEGEGEQAPEPEPVARHPADQRGQP